MVFSPDVLESEPDNRPLEPISEDVIDAVATGIALVGIVGTIVGLTWVSVKILDAILPPLPEPEPFVFWHLHLVEDSSNLVGAAADTAVDAAVELA